MRALTLKDMHFVEPVAQLNTQNHFKLMKEERKKSMEENQPKFNPTEMRRLKSKQCCPHTEQ